MPDPKPTNEEFITAFILFHFYLRKYILKAGRIENVIQIQDLSGNYKPPYALTRFAIGIIPKINRGRARTFFALNSPTAI